MSLTRSISVILRQLALECCSPQSSGMSSSSCTHAQMSAAEGLIQAHTQTHTLSRLFSLTWVLTPNHHIYLLPLIVCFSYIYVIRCDFLPEFPAVFHCKGLILTSAPVSCSGGVHAVNCMVSSACPVVLYGSQKQRRGLFNG